MRPPIKTRLNPRTWESATRQRLLLALAVVLLVLGWRWVIFAKGRRLQRLGEELVAVNMLVKYPVPNWAGSQILFAQSTEQGVGLHVLNLATGQRLPVYELAEGRILSGSLLLLDWSPDDSMLAYAKPVKGKKQEVVLCSSSVGKKVGSLAVVGLIKEFRWLSPASFAYLNDSNNIYVAARDAQGKWRQTQEFKGITQPPVTHFAAVSANELVWKQAGGIWLLDLAATGAERLWKPETNRLISCYFARENGKLLISAQNKDGSYQILALNLNTRRTDRLNEVTEASIGKVNWVNSGSGFAFQCPDHWGDSLWVRRRTGASQATVLFADGEVIDFKARRDRIFIYGSEGNEPPGIWEYTVGSEALRCVVAATEKPLRASRSVRHTSATLTNGTRVITYQRWSPARKTGKLGPLILGQTPYRWNAYPQLAAAAGYHFVTVNRKSWEEGIDQWEEDVLAVRAELVKKPEVDGQRIYLYGHSAETYPMSNLAASWPELWKGALMLSPSTLPDLTRCRLSTVLIDAGELDTGARERLTKYQADAARAGVAVKLVIHPQARHTSWSRTTELAKVKALAEFLEAN